MNESLPCSRERGSRPGNPTSSVKAEATISLEDVRIRGLVEQELLDKGGQLRLLGRRERAMIVVSNLRESKVGTGSECGVDGLSALHAPIARQIPEPFLRGILDDIESSRSDKTSQFVVIRWEFSDRVDERIKVL